MTVNPVRVASLTHDSRQRLRVATIVVGLAASWCLAASDGHAQTKAPLVPDLPPKSFMTKNTFYLPVKVDDRVRANLKEVRLYLKDDPTKPWLLQDKVAPTQTYFTFRAPRDGEYWFTVVTIDKMGKATPSDLRNEVPALIVVLDSQPPQVDVQLLPASAEGTMLQSVVRDANLDLTKTRLYFQTGDTMWRALEPLPGKLDQFCIPQQAVFTGMVCVEACDLAKNNVRKEFNLSEKSMARGVLPDQKPVQESSQAIKQTSFSSPEQVSRGSRPRGLEQVMTPPAGANVVPPSPSLFPADKLDESTGPALSGPELVSAGSGPLQVAALGKQIPQASALPVTAGADVPAKTARTGQASPASHQVVGKDQVFLDYQIDNKGASGVGKVEVWITRDHGQSWKKLCEDIDHKSPAEAELPGEGVYGITLVVTNGRGFGGTPPSAGDAPEMTIEIDHTKPVAEITGIQPGTGSNSGSLIVSWTARDKNLGTEPIDLFYAASPQGPWQPIARGLANDGQYRWTMPASSDSEAYIRLVVRDAAGNVTQVETTQPVTLDDQSRPRARVTGVSTTATR